MQNDPKSFVYWLQGFLELSGATTLNEQQVQVVKEHLALVLTKTTPSTVQPYVPVPIYPSNPMPSDKGWEITCTTTDKLYPTGPKCGVCNKVCSEEGGTCKKCQAITTTSDYSQSSYSSSEVTVKASSEMVQDLKVFTGVDLEKTLFKQYFDPYDPPSDANEITNVICALTC